VQLIEVSLTGVRSAVITLRAPETAMRIVLFPMLHLGSADYYQSVAARLADCDLIVAEGIEGRSVTAGALTLAYGLPARRRRLALTVQHIDYAKIGRPLIRPDMSARQFREGWRSVPFVHRLAVLCLVPPFALSYALLGTRRTLSRHLGTEDLPDLVDARTRQVLPQLTELILDRRDALLADCLATIHDVHRGETYEVAVVYGARHMPAISGELNRRYGYRPRTAEWLSVFDF
jgi:hypothetical protein